MAFVLVDFRRVSAAREMFQTVSAFVALDDFTVGFAIVFPVSDYVSELCTSN